MSEDLSKLKKAELIELVESLQSAVPTNMTALEHVQAAHDHVMAACAIYGEVHAIDTERMKSTMLSALQSARAIGKAAGE